MPFTECLHLVFRTSPGDEARTVAVCD